MSILTKLQDTQNKMNSFEEHPIQNLSLKDKIIYLNGLSLIMGADEEVHEKEKNYLMRLINTFSLDRDLLDQLVEFSQDSDEEQIEELLNTLKEMELILPFLIDSYVIARIDNSLAEEESEVLKFFMKYAGVKNSIMLQGFEKVLFNLVHYTGDLNYSDADLLSDEDSEKLYKSLINQLLTDYSFPEDFIDWLLNSVNLDEFKNIKRPIYFLVKEFIGYESENELINVLNNFLIKNFLVNGVSSLKVKDSIPKLNQNLGCYTSAKKSLDDLAEEYFKKENIKMLDEIFPFDELLEKEKIYWFQIKHH